MDKIVRMSEELDYFGCLAHQYAIRWPEAAEALDSLPDELVDIIMDYEIYPLCRPLEELPPFIELCPIIELKK